MARSQMDIASLLSGEVTPALLGRSDTEEYPQFLSAAENVYVEKHGGVVRRGGLQYAAEARSSKVRLIPFIFSRTDSYVMEFGDRYARLYQDSSTVDNIGAVQTYFGDSSSTKFQYPHSGVSQSDIGVVVTVNGKIPYYPEGHPNEGEVIYLVENTDYTVAATDTASNLLSDFNTTDWDGDATSIGTSWTIPNDNTATSPAGTEPVIKQSSVNLAHGAQVTMSVDATDVTFTRGGVTESNTSNIPLIDDGDFISIEQVDIVEGATGYDSVNASFAVEDTSGDKSSNFFWELHYNGAPINLANGVELGVNTAQTVSTGDFDLPEELAAGDVISLQIRAVGGHKNSVPQVSGGVTPSAVSVVGVLNPEAKLYSTVKNAASEEETAEIFIGSTPHTWTPFEDILIQGVQPLEFGFYTDPGLEIKLDNVSLKNSKPGWDITFTTPPALGEVIIIRDLSVAVPVALHTKNINNPSTGTPFEFQTPFTSDELDQLYWAQANDVMWFCHSNHKPWRLSRISSYEWVWDQPTLYGTPWDLPGTSWQADGTSTDYEFYFSVAQKSHMEIFFNGELVDAADWNLKTGQSFPVKDNGTVTFDSEPPIGTTVLITSTVSDYNPIFGYPRCVVFFQERLWFAATVNLPQTLWGSRVADFTDFAVKGNKQVLQPDDAVEYTIAAYTHESIEWLSSERVLIIGTSSTEHRLAPDEYIATDRLPRVSKMTDYGGAHQMPMYMGGLTCFVQQSGRQLRSFQQRSNMVLEEYESVELTWMANHMVKDLWIKEPYYALVPDNIAVMVREDGQLLTAMYDPSTGQMDAKDSAWSRQITDGTFESVCVVPTDFGHQIWVAVKRTIDGVEKTYVEFFSPYFFMDSAIFTAAGATSTDTLTNLGHLEGKTLDIVVDGAVHPQKTVTNGEITLDWPGTDIVVGTHYRPKIVTAPFTEGNPAGTGQGKPGRWSEIWCRLVNSAHPLMNGKRPPVRHPATPMGEPEPNITGAVRVFDTGYSYNKQITIEQDLPLRFQLVNIYGTFHTGAG